MLKAAIIFLLATVFLRADEAEQEARFKKLPAGNVVSPQHVIEGMALALGRTNPLGSAEKLEVKDGRGFDTTMRIVTRKPAAHPWSFHASAKTSAAAKRGDVMLAVFWARAAGASEEAESAFVFEHGGASRERSANFRILCEREWKRFFVPFRAVRDEPAGEAVMRFHAGFGPQVIEIGGLEIFNYGRRARLGDLPYTPLNYKGREPGAAWRTEAAARIEKLRKAAMFITVRNAKGKIMPWTVIRVRQVRHAYDFGSVVSSEPLLGKGDDSDMYRDVIMRAFNNVALENELHWPVWEAGRQRALDAVAWLRGAGIEVRGHALLCPGWKHLPAGSESLAAKPAELRTRILDHTREIVGALKGQVSEWDAVSEAVQNTDIQRALGQGILADVFKTAHAADEDARLFINDRGIFAMGGKDTGQQDACFKSIKGLLDTKAPVHGIAMQAQFDDMLTPPVRVWEILDRFGGLKLPIKVTDFDVDVWDEQAMADYTRDFMTAVFAHPATAGIEMSGFWENRHRIPNAAHWAADWSLRPAGRVWYDLVYKTWWTDVRAETNGRGVAKVRGFTGDYVIELGSGEKKKTVPFKLTKAGKWMTVILP